CYNDFSTGGCGEFITDATCMTDPSCTWDNASSECFNQYTGGCSEFVTDATCDVEPQCFWDTTATTCFEWGPGCDTYTDSVSCGGDWKCNWPVTTCEETSSNCANGINSSVCVGITGCTWNAIDLVCSVTSNTDCPGYIDELSCRKDPLCDWDSVGQACN
ncbi:hypothetical protein ACFLQK_00310, partial [bacterium]